LLISIGFVPAEKRSSATQEESLTEEQALQLDVDAFTSTGIRSG
jgi:hypothetical protein